MAVSGGPETISVTPSRNARTCAATSAAKSSSSSRSNDDSDIEQPPPLESTPQGDLIGVFEVAAHRKSTRQSGDFQPHRLDQSREIGRRCFALKVRVGGQDQLDHGAVGQPRHELAHSQVVGPDTLDRADRTAEHVVAPTELSRALDCHDVLGLLDDADNSQVAPGVAADAALVLFRHVAADPTEPDLRL